MVKELNRYTSNEFHDWQRTNLPSRFVIQDIDTWALVVSDSEKNYEPICLIELKRSYIEPEQWKPFLADKRSYLAIHNLAKLANLPLYIIYFKKGTVISDDSLFAVLQVDKVSDIPQWIDYKKTLYKAQDFKKIFPNLTR